MADATTDTPTTPVTETPTATTDTAAVAAPVADTLDTPTLLGGEPKADAPAEGEMKVGEAPKDAPAGAPEAYEFKLPDGMTLDKDALAEAEPVLRKLNLSNDAANELAPIAANLVQRGQKAATDAMTAQIVQTRKAWAEAAAADSEVGGTPEAHDAVKAVAARALDRFGGPEFREFLNATGIGNHPDMLRFAYRAGKAISEDGDFVRGDAAPAPKITREEKYYPNSGKKDG